MIYSFASFCRGNRMACRIFGASFIAACGSKSDNGASDILCKFILINWKIDRSSKGSSLYFSDFPMPVIYVYSERLECITTGFAILSYCLHFHLSRVNIQGQKTIIQCLNFCW